MADFNEQQILNLHGPLSVGNTLRFIKFLEEKGGGSLW